MSKKITEIKEGQIYFAPDPKNKEMHFEIFIEAVTNGVIYFHGHGLYDRTEYNRCSMRISMFRESIASGRFTLCESQYDISAIPLLNRNVACYNFSHRSIACMRNAGIYVLQQLLEKNRSYFEKIRNCGKKTLGEIINEAQEIVETHFNASDRDYPLLRSSEKLSVPRARKNQIDSHNRKILIGKIAKIEMHLSKIEECKDEIFAVIRRLSR